MGKRELTLRLTTENGEEVEMDVEMKADNPQKIDLCLSETFSGEIAITFEITFDEIG